MARTVKVRLELDRDDYKRGLRDAANETRGFDGEVRSLGKDVHATGIEVKTAGTEVQSMGREVDATAKKTASLGDEAEKAKRKTTGLGDETDKTRTKTRGFGEESDKAKTKIVDLAKEITTTKAALAALGEEFRKTGQVNVDELGKLSRSLRELERAKAAIEKLGSGGDRERPNRGLVDFALDEWVAKTSRSAINAIAGGLPEVGGLSSSLTTALVAGAAAAAPAIGAALNAGVLLAMGGGTLAAGIALAVRDHSVRQAWGQAWLGVLDELDSAAGVFVQPLVRAAQTVGAAFGSIMPSIRRDFATLAPLVDRLASGTAGLLTNMMPGFDRSIQAAVPMLRQLAVELPRLGSAMSSFFDSIARGGPGAVAFFHELMMMIDGTIVWVGKLVEWLSKAYELSHKIPGMGGLIQTLGDMTKDTGDKSKDASAGLDALGSSADGVVQPLDSATTATKRLEGSFRDAIMQAEFFTKTLDSINGGNIALATSQIGAQRAVRDFKDALKESHGSLDITTEKGAAAREAAIRLAQAAGEVAQRTYEQSGSSAQGAVALEGYRQALYNTARQSGLTEVAAHALVDEYLHVPPEVSTQVKAPGLSQARDDVKGLGRELAALDGTMVNTYVNTYARYYDSGTPKRGHANDNDRRWGGITEHAQTGLLRDASIYSAVSSGARYAFAEPQTRGEAFIPKSGDYGRSMSILSQAASWYGADVVPRQAPGYAAFANSRPMPAGGGTVAVHLTSDPIPLTLDGRKVAELVIEDGRNGGPINTYVRQVAAR